MSRVRSTRGAGPYALYSSYRSGSRRRYKGARRNAYASKNPTRELIPESYLTTMVYDFGLNFTGTSLQGRTYRLNSINDTDVNTAGNQRPVGYTMYSTYYDSYTVFGAKVHITIAQTTGSGVYCMGADSNSVYLYTSTYQAQMDRDISSTFLIAGETKTLSRYFPIHSVMAVSKDIVRTDDSYTALFGSNPDNTAFLHFIAAPFDNFTTHSSSTRVRITYYVRCTGRVPQLTVDKHAFEDPSSVHLEPEKEAEEASNPEVLA